MNRWYPLLKDTVSLDSSIQDVDSLHSVIERHLKPFDVFSPIALVRHLKNMKYKETLYIKLMEEKDFKEFSCHAKNGTYSAVKYASAKEIIHHKSDVFEAGFRTRFGGQVSTHTVRKVQRLCSGARKPLPTPGSVSRTIELWWKENRPQKHAGLHAHSVQSLYVIPMLNTNDWTIC